MDGSIIYFDAKEKLAKSLAVIEKSEFQDESILRLGRILALYSGALAKAIHSEYKISYEDMAENLMQGMDELNQWKRKYDQNLFFAEFRKSFEKPGKNLSDMQMERLKAFAQIDVNKFKNDKKYQSDQYNKASNIAYDIAKEQTEASEENITEADLKDAYDKEKEIGFQEWLYNKSENFKKKYYIYSLVINFILFILGTILGFYITEALAKGTVKKDPEPQTTAIYNITEETNVTIIGEVNYYYQIIFEDENGNEITGYIAKKNVKFLPIEADMSE